MAFLPVLAVVWIVFTAPRDDVAAEPDRSRSRPEIGFLAPDFTLETVGGESIRLAKLRGQVVLINFWATWCSLAARKCLPSKRPTTAIAMRA
jgi:hypothetical protein